MKRIVLAVLLCVLAAAWALAGALQSPRVAAPPSQQLLASLDPGLSAMAKELKAAVTKGAGERSLRWTTKEGVLMCARITIEQVQGKSKLRVTMDASRDLTLPAGKSMLEMSQSFNIQYLDLQQQMQDENRRFTLVSNIMKTKHDTSKSAISNVR